MRQFRAVLARIAGMFGRQRADEELRTELETHLQMQIAENLRQGMDPAEARRRALLAAGGLTQASDAVRDQRGLPWIESALADYRYALRGLRHSPGFTALVVVTLALGLGANTAIFSVVRGVLLEPLPHRNGDRLVYLRQSADGPGGASIAFSVPEVRDIREGVPSLAGIAEYSPWSLVFQSDDGSERLRVGLVTGNYFDVMGLSPVIGRLTEASDDGPGVEPVVVLTHEHWLRRFGGDSSIVGRQLRLDERSVTVIGVVEPAPFFPDRVDALLNMVISEHHLSATMVEGRTHRMTEVVARVRPGTSLDQARTEVEAVYGRMRGDFAEAYDAASNYRVEVIPFREVLGERARLTLRLLMGAAAFVLMIAVASVSNLALMRGVRREQEFVVRTALGAGAARLRRLLLAENLVLAVASAVVGVAVAIAALELLVPLADRYSPRANEIRLDAPVFAFMLALSVMVALLLSFLLSMPREGRFTPAFVSGGHRISGNLSSHRLQRGLVVVQIAITVILLAGAGLLTRTMIRLSDVNTGLRTEEVLTMQATLLTSSDVLSNSGADAVAKQQYERIRREFAALPGVTSAGLGSPAPLRSSDVRFDVKAEGTVLEPGQPVPRAELRTADPHFFRASGIPLTGGRPFAITDAEGAGLVVIVNQSFADALFPGDDPIGKRVAWTGEVLRFTPLTSDWRTIVGVTANTRDGGQDAEHRPVMYMPFAQMPAFTGTLVIRADSDVASLVPAATRIIRRIAPQAPIERVMTVAQIKDQSIAPRRLNAALISSFGVLALVIATVGIAGVLAFSVSARTNEIGIRMSLGADAARVQRMVLREGGVLIAAGLVLGVSGAISGARIIQGLLFGVQPHDAVTFASVTLMMIAIGTLACWIPALRAARIDPAITMRSS